MSSLQSERSSGLVTLGITSYNAADTISAAIKSALFQALTPLEVLVVDDASTDRSCDIVEDQAKSSSQIRLLRNPKNRGVAFSRSRIVREAKGEFIAFFDDDDVSDPTRIGRQLKRMLEYERDFANGAPVICHTARKQVAADGSVRVAPTMGQIEGQLAPNGREVARRILAGEPLKDGYGAVPTCSQMARTKTYRDLHGFDPAFRRSEDTEFCVRLALAGGHFVGIAEPLVTQTLTKTGEKNLDTELGYVLAMLEKHRDVFDGQGHYLFCRNWVETKYAWLARDKPRFIANLLKAALLHPRLACQRIRYALPTMDTNRAFARFHAQNGDH